MNTHKNSIKPVIVIGGGLAGLTCATELSDAGMPVHVIEASQRLGGRAQSWTDAGIGGAIDLGPHILLSTYPRMVQWLTRLGTDKQIYWLDDGVMIRKMRGTHEELLKFSKLPPPFHFLPSLVRSRRLGLRDVLSHRKLFARALSISANDCLKYDQKTGLQLLQEFGLTPHAIDEVWRFIAYAILNLPLEECSGASLMRFARFLCGRKDYRVGLARVGLGDLFCEPATRVVKAAGGTVEVGVSVQTLERAQDHWSVRLSDGRSLQAERIVLALPPAAMAQVLTKEQKDAAGLGAIEAIDACPYISIYLKFDRRIADVPFWARAFKESDLNCDFYDLAAFRNDLGTDQSVIASNIIYSKRAEHLSESEILARTLSELAEQFPSIRSAQLVHHVINRIPMAIHCPRPGTESMRPDFVTQLPGLYLAGDWTNTQLPSSMESACDSGVRCAHWIRTGRDATGVDLNRLAPFTAWNARFWDRVYSA